MIVDVTCDDNTIQIAKILQEDTETYKIKFLEQIRPCLYDFCDNETIIKKEEVSGFYDVETLEDTKLYARVNGGYEIIDDSEDEDFEITESDEEESEDDISLIDEEDLS